MSTTIIKQGDPLWTQLTDPTSPLYNKDAVGAMYAEVKLDDLDAIIAASVRIVQELPVTTILNAGISAVEKQDAVLAALYSEMDKQTEHLEDINEAIDALNDLRDTIVDSDKDLAAMTNKSDLEALFEAENNTEMLSIIRNGNNLTIDEIDTLIDELTTMQSSAGATNEDMSLKLNDAASTRSALFTQLQTLLQTLMQTLRQLSQFS